MAQRRMFSLKIIDSDAFLDMPVSARELYFQLGMRADDDGFVNPKKIIRMIGASEDDLRLLIAKRFVLHFENGVVVIKHWLINNLIRKDFYQETTYLEQKEKLEIKENKAYTEISSLMLTPRKQIVNNLSTQVRIGKDRIGKRDTKPNGFSSILYLKNIPLDDIKEFIEITTATENQIRNKGESLFDYCESKGRRYKNYKAFLRNALRKDYAKKSALDEKWSLSG